MKKLAAYAVVGLGAVAYNVATEANRDQSGAIVDAGSVDAFTIRMGDCFNNTGSLGTGEAGEVSRLPGVPCTEPHDNEVYAVFDVNMAEFPGDEVMSEHAFDVCLDRFEGFVGLAYEDSILDITALYPSSESWGQHNDREVVCAIYDMNGERRTGTARDSGV